MSDPEVLDLTVDEEDKKKAPKLDLAALAREREQLEDLRARCEAVARRFPKPGAVVAETRAPTVLGRGGGKKTVLQQRTEKLSLYPEWLRDPKSTRPYRYSLQIREQRQRRGCIAAKLAPEAQRQAPGPSLRDRLRGLVAGPFEGEGRAVADHAGEC